MKPAVLLLLSLLLGFGQCGQPRNPLVGKYTVEGRNFDGKRIFGGTLSIDTFENGEVKGLCKLVDVDPSLGFGKDGPWIGEVNGDEIVLDLAPLMDDGGVILEGHWREGRLSGTVRVDSFVGARDVGTFEATRQ
ncbi:MAG TPA: hypothetical protein VJS13_13520 [Pyrinomonadaceae bacterium]|nr:hypothetical protein [Pyrinomonadaceae bacterium]